MTSPVANHLKSLRFRTGKSQSDFGVLLGFEQAYISALELSVKHPTAEFLARVIDRLNLSAVERQELEIAASSSVRKFTLSPDSPTDAYIFCNALFQKIEKLGPAQINLLKAVLEFDERFQLQPTALPTRTARTARVETPM